LAEPFAVYERIDRLCGQFEPHVQRFPIHVCLVCLCGVPHAVSEIDSRTAEFDLANFLSTEVEEILDQKRLMAGLALDHFNRA
jgi:hypothetical protein